MDSREYDQAIKPVIAWAIWYRQRALIENFDEARGIPTWANVCLAIHVLSADTEKWRAPDKLLGMCAECVERLLQGQSMGRIKQASKGLFIGNDELRIGLKPTHRITFRRLAYLTYVRQAWI